MNKRQLKKIKTKSYSRKIPTVVDFELALRNRGENNLANELNRAIEKYKKTHITFRTPPDSPEQIISEKLEEIKAFLEMSEEEQTAFLKKRQTEIELYSFPIAPSGPGKTMKLIRPNLVSSEPVIQDMNQIKTMYEDKLEDVRP